MNGVILQSLGAAETVTGSKHLVKTPELTIMVDCGLFQGLKSLREKNWQQLPVEPSSIDLVIITQAHPDHCGYIPLLVKSGFQGKIYMTPATKELTELILLENAKMQEEDAEKANINRYSKHRPALPLYTTEDAEASFSHFVTKDYDEVIRLSDNLYFRFKLSGYVLGACSVLLNCYGRSIVFSGDIGSCGSSIQHVSDHFRSADYVVMESTYGDRQRSKTDPEEELAKIIQETTARGGNILIPGFTIGRAQELIYILNRLKLQNKLPPDISIIMDSPMAATATDVHAGCPEFSKISKKEASEITDNVIINRNYNNSARIIRQKRSKIVIASSDMFSGGRSLEYLKNYVSDDRNTILMVGFQAEGTRGKALLDNAFELKIHGRYYPILANVAEVTGLSPHAFQSELLDWIKQFKSPPGLIMLVHGERATQEALRVKIQQELHIPVKIMRQNQEVILFSC